jgi:uncharacterized protein
LGLIVEDDVEEINIIRSKHSFYKNSSHYLITILPTYSCNFSCWYCTQIHREEQMTLDIQEKVKKHIASYLLDNKIKLFELSWFGGEPLLCMPVIKNISEFSQQFCKEHHIGFINGITTNGYLVTPQNAEELLKFKIYDYQITIDGARESHNKTRNQNGLPSFDTILRNICTLCDVIPQARITMRFNYDDKNIDIERIVNEVNDVISDQYRKRIHILPRKVWQVSAKHDRTHLIDQLLCKFKLYGYQTYPIDVSEDFSGCYVNKVHYNTIYPNGAVGKCTTQDIDKAKGRLSDDGSLEWTKDFLENKIDTPFFENQMCLSCKYLPICMGPCPQNNGMIKIDLTHLKCHKSQVDTLHNDDILRYCIEILSQNTNK